MPINKEIMRAFPDLFDTPTFGCIECTENGIEMQVYPQHVRAEECWVAAHTAVDRLVFEVVARLSALGIKARGLVSDINLLEPGCAAVNIFFEQSAC